MSGGRLSSFRQGDISEYLAQYLLSRFGLVTPIPRQEDIGIDFYCLVADQEKGMLTFGYPYSIQVKSNSENEVKFGGYNKDKSKWKQHEIAWIFRQELPLFFGFVNKDKLTMDIHCISSLWFLFYEGLKQCYELVLRPRKDSNSGDIPKPFEEPFTGVPETESKGKKKYIVDIGQPIIQIDHSEIDKDDYVRNLKKLLRNAVNLETANIRYKDLGVPYMNWIVNNETNKEIKPGWAYFSGGPNNLDSLWKNVTPSIIALGINLDKNNDEEGIAAIKPLIKFLPPEMIYDAIMKDVPRVFGK